jgi:N-acetylglucosamine-6-phosphate deacetylase
MRTVLTAEKLWNGTSLLDRPLVVIEDRRIASIATRETGELPAGTQTRVLDYPSATLAPAFLDVHTHGADGQLFGYHGYRACGYDPACAFRTGKAVGAAAG